MDTNGPINQQMDLYYIHHFWDLCQGFPQCLWSPRHPRSSHNASRPGHWGVAVGRPMVGYRSLLCLVKRVCTEQPWLRSPNSHVFVCWLLELSMFQMRKEQNNQKTWRYSKYNLLRASWSCLVEAVAISWIIPILVDVAMGQGSLFSKTSLNP